MNRPVLTLRTRKSIVVASEPAPVPTLTPVAAPPPASDVPYDAYFFVWAIGEQCPKRRHASLGSACTEARRLRTIAPQKTFGIYLATRVAEADKARGVEEV